MRRSNHPRWYAPLPLLILTVALSISAACTGGYALARRDTAVVEPLVWFSPAQAIDRLSLDRWSGAVGPPVIMRRESPHAAPFLRRLYVVSWNVALGHGDVSRLLTDLRRTDPDAAVVLLLQEVFRKGPEVPTVLMPGAAFAGKLGRDDPAAPRGEIENVAAQAGLQLYYVPSMRNGGPMLSDEDRGNAILSSLPLSDFEAVELPFERQRRVAVAASVSGVESTGAAWSLRFVSTHLDNMVGLKRGWLAGAEFGRTRQARALLEYLRTEDSVVLGGDFNTWFGFDEPAYREVVREFPDTTVTDRRATFGGLLRLDHLFFRLPDGWRGRFARGQEKYGSDHYPLIATVELP